MYFSKWLLKSNKPVDPYQLHRKIWQLFPDKADDKRSFLFRVESTKQNCEQHILLQSISQPQEISDELILLRKSKEINLDIIAGNSYRFMLCANPTKNRKPFSFPFSRIWYEGVYRLPATGIL